MSVALHVTSSAAAPPPTMPVGAKKPKERIVRTELPHKLGFLLEMHRYKVAYGGRGAAKSRSFAAALLNLGAAQRLRILCAREIQRSIKDSVHKLLSDTIEALGLGGFYQVLETEIRGRNGTEIIFSGLAGHTVESIKSFEGIDIVWVEEAQSVSKRSWDVLIPTIRAENSEIWVSFNPDMDTDDTYRRFVVNPPPGAAVVKMNWQDNPWFPAVLNAEREHALRFAPDDYANIWEGACKTSVAGAIYSRELAAMYEDRRVRPLPYDPRLPVHTIWDLGWNDAMSILFIQKPVPSAVNIINYLEDSQRTYAQYKAQMDGLGYSWGFHYLPHDGESKNPQTGKNAKQTLEGLGLKNIKIIARDPDPYGEGIRRTRMMLPRIYLDDTERQADSGHLGCHRLLECFKRYRRGVPSTTGEPGDPVHDEYSHGMDAVRGLAQIVDQIRNEIEIKRPPTVAKFRSSVRGAGALG